MRKYSLILFLSLICAFEMSCKKNPTYPIVGTWQEQPPCLSGTGFCYNFTFASNCRYYSSSPASDSGTYILSNNNTSITFNGLRESGTYNYQINNGNELILDKFFAVYSTGTPPPPVNVTLMKVY